MVAQKTLNLLVVGSNPTGPIFSWKKQMGFEPTWVTPLHSKTILNCFETESFTWPIFSWKIFCIWYTAPRVKRHRSHSHRKLCCGSRSCFATHLRNVSAESCFASRILCMLVPLLGLHRAYFFMKKNRWDSNPRGLLPSIPKQYLIIIKCIALAYTDY